MTRVSVLPNLTRASNFEHLVAVERALSAVNESRFADAARACRELAERDEDPTARASWTDHAELLDRLAQGKPVAAFMQAHAMTLADELRVPLVAQLAGELERAAHPLLAIATFDGLERSNFVESEQRRLARELDPRLAEDQHARAHAVATQIVEHFRHAAENGDVRALRATARALIDLDRPKEALTRVRQAVSREPSHFPTRLLEADLLDQLGERDARQALLLVLCTEFPARAEPARMFAQERARDADKPEALADATYWYTQAIERAFDEPLVFELAKLLERSGKIDEAIAQLEAGHARSRDSLALEDFARELARLERERGRPEQAKRWSAEIRERVGKRERGYAIAAIALMVILLAVLVGFALAM